MRKFSNRYIFIYSALLVSVVAVVLTIVSISLKPLQQRNYRVEQKQMILKAIGIDAQASNAEELYVQHIQECEVNGLTYYRFEGGIVIPMHGTGLWGPIWGYLALDSTSTVVGAVFDHKGETPGLGGEIASDKFASRFVGKSMREYPIRLKKNADRNSLYEVDAISGGTMTSNGVTAMLESTHKQYFTLLFGCRNEE
ncbi:MAG: FMN-binding protein [Bacteroidales bacterium]|nr:FMN-binding protein [Bacteroidales bacterium]